MSEENDGINFFAKRNLLELCKILLENFRISVLFELEICTKLSSRNNCRVILDRLFANIEVSLLSDKNGKV